MSQLKVSFVSAFRHVLPALVLSSAILGACSSEDTVSPAATELPRLEERDVSAAIQTDALNYDLRETGPDGELGASIITTFTNPIAGPVYVKRCGLEPPLFFLEKRVTGEWALAYSTDCPAFRVDPLVVGAGETYTDTIRIWNCRGASCYPRFEVDPIPGDYRFVLDILEQWDGGPGGVSLPKDQRVSNPFRLHR